MSSMFYSPLYGNFYSGNEEEGDSFLRTLLRI